MVTAAPSAAPPRNLRLEWVDPATLDDNPRNWRRHPQGQTDALRDLILGDGGVGWAGALLYNERTGRLIDGHGRKKIGAAEVPVLVGAWDEAQERTILATLDPLAGMAQADTAALDTLLRDVDGGSVAVQALLSDLAAENGLYREGAGEPEEAPEPQIDRAAELQEQWQTAPGQLWVIPSQSVPGREHRLLCGDATNVRDVARLMGGEAAALVVTSPPYGVGKDYETGGLEEWRALLRGTLACWVRYAPLAAINLGDVKVGPDHRELHTYGELVQLCCEAGWPLIGTRIWVKGAAWAGQGPYWLSSYRAVDEYECIGLFGTTDFVERTSEEWRYRGVWDIPSVGRNQGHPAMFPVEVPRRLVQLLSDEGAVIGEPFAGAASTTVAAEQAARLCYGMDRDPRYIAVSLERLAGLGLAPRLESER